MKFSATPVFFALLASLTLVNAGPIADTSSDMVRREPSADSGIEILDARHLDEFDLSARDEFDLSERDEERLKFDWNDVQKAMRDRLTGKGKKTRK
jgi:hypothetical protein